MRAFVFTDQALERYAGQFVWLAVNTEKAESSKFLTKFPISVWPTLLVIDPKSESVALRYAGDATVPQLGKLLDDGQRVVRAKSPDTADALLVSADRLSSRENKNAEAAALYQQAIAKAPAKWPRLGRASEGYIFTLSMAHDNERCASEAKALYPKVKGTLSGANVASLGLSCAIELDDKNVARKGLTATLEAETGEALHDPKIDMSGDDRSGLYESLVDARHAANDSPGEQKLKEEWAAFLEQEAAKAKTPEQRAVYDSHRLSAYIALGIPEKAVPMLEQSERDFPDDYNPPARLAVTYKEMKKYDDALAASDRALKKAYGPRKLGILRTRADIYLAKGDKDSAKKTLNEAIAFARALPAGQKSDRQTASLEKKLGDVK
jgi:tetratricopeptide (TPR) repeat protein